MNRRGTVLLSALFALLLTGALATAALLTARLRLMAGMRNSAAARTTLAVQQRLEEQRASLTRSQLDSMEMGERVALADGDTLMRLGPSLYRLRVSAEERLADGALLARDGAIQLLERPAVGFPDSAAVMLHPDPFALLSPRVIAWLLAEGSSGGRGPRVVLQPGGELVDGMGSGVLLGLGDIELSGDFSFTGVILARGRATLRGRARVQGSVIAADGVQLLELAEITHSATLVQEALAEALPPLVRVPGGWWRVP